MFSRKPLLKGRFDNSDGFSMILLPVLICYALESAIIICFFQICNEKITILTIVIATNVMVATVANVMAEQQVYVYGSFISNRNLKECLFCRNH